MTLEEIQALFEEQEFKQRDKEASLSQLLSKPPAETGISIDGHEQPTPGVLSSFTKGMAESIGLGSVSDFGTDRLPPTTFAEQAAGFGGSVLLPLGTFLLTRVPAFQATSSVLGSTRTASVVADFMAGTAANAPAVISPLLLDEEINKEDIATYIGLEALMSVVLPSPWKKPVAELAQQGVKSFTKEGVEDSFTQVAKSIETEEFTTPILQNPFVTKELNQVYKESEGHIPGLLNSVTKAVDDLTAKANDFVLAQSAKVKADRLPPQKVLQLHDQYVDEGYKEMIETVGALAPHEVKIISKELADTPFLYISADRIAGKVSTDSRRLFLGGEIPDGYAAKVASGVDLGKRNEVVREAVGKFVNRLQDGDDRLALHLSPYMTDAKFKQYGQKVREADEAAKAVLNRPEFATLKQDIRTALNYLRDPNMPVDLPPGFSQSSAARLFPGTVARLADILGGDTTLLKKELDSLSGVIKEGDAETVRNYQAGVSRLLSRVPKQEMDQYEKLLQAVETGQPLGAYDPVAINTVVTDSLQRKLKGHLGTLDPELQTQLDQVDAQLPYLAPAEAAPIVNQIEGALNQKAQELLANPMIAREFADKVSDPHIKNLLTSYHALAGDAMAVSEVKHIARNPGQRVNESITNNLRDNKTRVDSPDGPVNPVAPTADQAFDHAKVGNNPFLRYLESPITYMTNLVKSAPDSAKVYIQRALDGMKFLAERRRSYLQAVAKTNKELDEMFTRWRSQGTTKYEVVIRTIDDIGRKADDMIRDGKSTEEIDDAIAAHLAKQDGFVRGEYNQYRSWMDKMRDDYNTAIDKMNERFGTDLEHIKYRPGYIPFIYDGQWKVSVITGKDHAQTLMVNNNEELAKGLQELIERGSITSSVKSLRIEPKWADALDDFDAASSLMKDGQAWEINTQDLIKQFELRGAFDSDTIGNVLFGSINPRNMGLESLRKKTEEALAISTRLGHRFTELSEPALELRRAAQDLDKMNLRPVADDVRSYANEVMGRSGDLERRVDHFMGSVFDHLFSFGPSRAVLEGMGIHNNGRVVRNTANMFNFMGRMLTIGFNPMTAMIQWLILPTNVGPVLGWNNIRKGLRNVPRFTRPGRWHRLAQRAGINIKDSGGVRSWFDTDNLGGSGFGMQERIRKPKTLMSRAERFQDSADYYSMWMFNESENMIRSASLYAGVLDAQQRGAKLLKGKSKLTHQDKRLQRIADKLGRTVDDEAVHDEYALEMMFDLNFDFDITGLNRFARNPFTKVAAQFKTYFFQEMEFLLGRKMELSAAERFQSLAMFTAFGGLMAMPFAEDLDNLVTWATGKSPKLWMYENMPDVMIAGLPAMGGVNFSNQVSLGGARTLSPLTDLADWKQGVFLSKMWGAYTKVNAGRASIPEALLRSNSMMNKMLNAKEMWETDRVLSPGGTRTVAKGGKMEALMMGMGLSTFENQELMDLYTIGNSLNRVEKRKRTSLRKEIVHSKDPYKKARELGVPAKDVSAWLKGSRKEGLKKDIVPYREED